MLRILILAVSIAFAAGCGNGRSAADEQTSKVYIAFEAIRHLDAGEIVSAQEWISRCADAELKRNVSFLLEREETKEAIAMLNAYIDTWLVSRACDSRQEPFPSANVDSAEIIAFILELGEYRQSHPSVDHPDIVKDLLRQIQSTAQSARQGQTEKIENRHSPSTAEQDQNR
jgi:hypothetical protein